MFTKVCFNEVHLDSLVYTMNLLFCLNNLVNVIENLYECQTLV